jgi:hypothetical protein
MSAARHAAAHEREGSSGAKSLLRARARLPYAGRVRRRLSASGILCVSLVLAGFAASAQMPIEQSDRPGEADPPAILPKGAIQLEGGVVFGRLTGGDDPDTGTLAVPELTVRIGLVDWLELRLQVDGLLYEFRDGASNRALASDLALGAKLGGIAQRGLLPETSLLAGVSLPVGSDAATSDGFDPILDGLYQWQLTEDVALVVNTRFSAPTQGSDDPRRIFEFGPQASLDWQITPTIGAFVEYFGAIKTRGVADEHSMDGGFTWLIAGQRLQLDVSGGGGLNDAAPDWFVSAGLSIRFQAPWAR